jgi:hypothetical protein
MKAKDLRDVFFDLIRIVDVGKELPAYLFSKKFEHHLFFDADITTSDLLILGIKEVVVSGVGPLLPFVVFSPCTREILGVVEPEEDWPKKVMGMTEVIRQRGNYDGYIIVDSELRWAAYQDNPVSLGVFAFGGKNPWSYISQGARDCFVSMKRMEDLFISEASEDIDMINIFGREFFLKLIKNYA